MFGLVVLGLGNEKRGCFWLGLGCTWFVWFSLKFDKWKSNDMIYYITLYKHRHIMRCHFWMSTNFTFSILILIWMIWIVLFRYQTGLNNFICTKYCIVHDISIVFLVWFCLCILIWMTARGSFEGEPHLSSDVWCTDYCDVGLFRQSQWK